MAKYGEARPSADHSTAATSPATSAAWATSVNVDLRNVETLMKQEKTIDKHTTNYKNDKNTGKADDLILNVSGNLTPG